MTRGRSVVNGNLRHHEIENLYVVDGSVYQQRLVSIRARPYMRFPIDTLNHHRRTLNIVIPVEHCTGRLTWALKYLEYSKPYPRQRSHNGADPAD